jgi:iron complex transport system substrate-binding protein
LNFITGLATGMLMLGLSGACTPAPSPQPRTTTTTAAPQPSAVAPDTAAGSAGRESAPAVSRTIKHAMGETSVPANPQRVVVLDTAELDSALALGVTPVGAVTVFADGDFQGYLKPQTSTVKKVGTIEQPNLESIAALKPDLILSSKLRHEKIFPQLSQIAPTVFTDAVGVTWRENLQLHAEALGRRAQAEALLTTYRARLEELKAKLGPRRERTPVSILRSFPDHVRLYQKASFIGTVLQDAGLPRPPAQDKDAFAEQVRTKEAIPAMDGDVIFVLHYSADKGSVLKDWMADPLWQNLKGVKASTIYEVADDTWALGIGILAANRVIDDLFLHLLGSAAQAPAASRVVVHAMGETHVPAAPQRVVVLEEGPLNSVLALGMIAVGAVTALPGADFPAYLGERTTGIQNVGTILQPNLESIAALRPDLILSVKARHEAIYPQLSQIAPTIFTETFRGSWRANFLKDAEALGKSDEAMRLMSAYQRRLDQFQIRMGDRLKRTNVSVVRFVPGDAYLYQKASFIGTILADAGLPRPPIQDMDEFVLKASQELIPQMDGDVVFLTSYGPPDKTQLAEFRNQPLWKQLEAERNGMVYTVSDEYWMVGTGIIAASRVVDDLEMYLLDGAR